MSVDERFRGQQFAWIWAVAWFAGVATITLSPGSATLSFPRLAGPILIMVGYAIVGYRRCTRVYKEPALHEARVAQLADSLYFLGFLWTLWALIDSFVIKNLTGSVGVFRIFGYALVTTAAGMFSRMLLLQFRYSGEEQLAVAQNTVEDELRQFSTEIKNTTASLEELKTATAKALYEWNDVFKQMTAAVNTDVRALGGQVSKVEKKLNNIHTDALERIYASVESATVKLVAEMRVPIAEVQNSAVSSFADVARMGEEVQREAEGFARTLHGGAEALKKELEGFARQVSEIRVPADFQVTTTTITDKVRRIEEALEAFLTALSRNRDFERAVTQSTDELKGNVDKLVSEMGSLATRIRTIRVPEELALRTDELTAKMRDLENGVARLSSAFNGTSDLPKRLDNLPEKVVSPADTLDRSERRVEPFSTPREQLRPFPRPTGAEVQNPSRSPATNKSGLLAKLRGLFGGSN